MYTDSTGYFWNLIIGTVIGAAVGFTLSVASQMIAGDEIDWGLVMVATGADAISGLIASTGIGMIGSGVAGGMLGGAQDAAAQLIGNNGDFGGLDYTSIGISAGIGCVAGLIAGSGYQKSNTYQMKVELDNLRLINTAFPSSGTASQINGILGRIGAQATRDVIGVGKSYFAGAAFAGMSEYIKKEVLQFD
jgi:hypothetical protein